MFAINVHTVYGTDIDGHRRAIDGHRWALTNNNSIGGHGLCLLITVSIFNVPLLNFHLFHGIGSDGDSDIDKH